MRLPKASSVTETLGLELIRCANTSASVHHSTVVLADFHFIWAKFGMGGKDTSNVTTYPDDALK